MSILACATLAYSLLRWLGLTGLRGPGGPVRHPARCRRIRALMQDLMYLAARPIETGRRLKLAYARGCCALAIYRDFYHRLT